MMGLHVCSVQGGEMDIEEATQVILGMGLWVSQDAGAPGTILIDAVGSLAPLSRGRAVLELHTNWIDVCRVVSSLDDLKEQLISFNVVVCHP